MAATFIENVHIINYIGPNLVHEGDATGRELTVADGDTLSDYVVASGRKSLDLSGVDATGRELTEAGGSTPGRIRTFDLRFRRPLLYPAELRARQGKTPMGSAGRRISLSKTPTDR